MPKKWLVTEAYAAMGATLYNTRWSCSAVATNDSAVVVSLWTDRFDFMTKTYDGTETADTSFWLSSPACVERTRNLIRARDQFEGRFLAVRIWPKDRAARTRSIESCQPEPNWIMELTELLSDGQFKAKLLLS